MNGVSAIVSCYRAEPYLDAFFDSVRAQTVLADTEIVLVHNAPSAVELGMVEAFRRDHGDRLRHIVVEAVEPIAASFNRGIRAARHDLVTLWNVDDLRTRDSLELERAVLDSHPDAIATYGDFVIVARPGDVAGRLVRPPDFEREAFTRASLVGPFPMWRRSACAQAGLFDEQLDVAVDYDFFIRLAFRGRMQKAEGLLGYFLYAGAGLSSRPGTRLGVEQTLVELRYGLSERIHLRPYPKAPRYRPDQILFDGAWHPVADLVPGHAARMRERRRSRLIGYADRVLSDFLAPAHLLRPVAGRAKRRLLGRDRRRS